ncbi:transposon ty3-g Gag-Pol polyprotein [Plakobranchus ocellatus]|uniref:Transposon ty3-g Gag-Pol polyprotein n=1 Tax=Plakobranchus ocellatus TaxID=259542 RepID=A0AAV4BZ56_9GAST|nr:transposon ty3-g Gag-Pol polyprotein [Plakobranchus ocellatus]
MVERFHRMLKAALKTRFTGNNWVEELPWVLFGFRTAPRKTRDICQQSSSYRTKRVHPFSSFALVSYRIFDSTTKTIHRSIYGATAR